MMIEIEDIDGDRQLIAVESIRRVYKSDDMNSETDDEPLAIISVPGDGVDIILKNSFDAFKRAIEGGGIKIIRG